MSILTPLELKMKLPMLLEIDNKGSFYLINNWSVGNRTRHVDTLQLFLRDMKDQVFQLIWISGNDNEVVLTTKKTPSSFFEKHHGYFNGEE